ncbi:acetoacetyl-CoA synthetase [Trichonephila clavipes]|nr:acetoacetyl-CoA synthetase [Trichonephila clavipes]
MIMRSHSHRKQTNLFVLMQYSQNLKENSHILEWSQSSSSAKTKAKQHLPLTEVHDLEEINDYICVGQTNSEGDVRAVLFVKLRDGLTFTPAVRDKIAEKIDEALWRDLVPEVILDVKDIPLTYNIDRNVSTNMVKNVIQREGHSQFMESDFVIVDFHQ